MDEEQGAPEQKPPADRAKLQAAHAVEQMTGYMASEAMNSAAFFKGLIDGGLYRFEALDVMKIQVMERFKAIYSAKPTKPPPTE
jgi:hypothetical protein